MKKLLLICLLLVTGFSSMASSDPSADAQACTTRFFQLLNDKNGSSLAQVLTFDFGLVSFDGQMVDSEMLTDAVNSGFITIETSSTSSLRSRTYGDASVVTGLWNTKGTLQGNTFATEVVFSALCVKQGGTWKLASIQFTPVR